MIMAESKKIDVDRAENKPNGTGHHFSLNCSYYTKSFSNVNSGDEVEAIFVLSKK